MRMRKIFLAVVIIFSLSPLVCAETWIIKAGDKSSAVNLEVTSREPAKKIGLIGAMDVEIALLKESAVIIKTEKIAGMEFFSGKIGSADIVIVKSGVGKVNAGICAQILITHFGVNEIINTGVAGSLRSDLNISSIVIAVDCVQHDFDVSPLNFAKGEIPYTGKFAFETDDKLRGEIVKAAKKFAPFRNIVEGRICTGDQFISDKSQKDAITKNFGGDCCDMESGAIAQVCYLNNIPFAIIRAISDSSDSSDYEEFKEVTARLSASIVKSMLEGR
ncbi:MAG: 5'-methylthioadenosine/adenosylhomocysteine nucleosidase [Synergistaceae bacterium]|nr:5'-methylthioadenosine/adenosylhomocysteine nucleosidase [Synergistaceae bacterium]